MTKNYTLKITLFIFMFLFASFAFAQVGIGTTTPNSSAILEIVSTDKGVLMPRVALSSMTLATPLASHIAGMMVYNTTAGGDLSSGIYINDGIGWTKPAITSFGDVKYSFIAIDHNGWYLLNGRVLTSLSDTAQAKATALGFSGNLPNATDRFLKAKDGAEILGNTGGSSTITVNQANLPNVNFTGTTNATGDHTHSYTDLGDTTISSLGLLGIGTGADNTSGSYATGSSGNHSHTTTVSSGGSNTPISNEPAYIVTNIFVYLGT
jgi:hypothetical protein